MFNQRLKKKESSGLKKKESYELKKKESSGVKKKESYELKKREGPVFVVF